MIYKFNKLMGQQSLKGLGEPDLGIRARKKVVREFLFILDEKLWQ